jgi:hypothetical protein
MEFGECPTGDSDLHKYIGELYYKGMHQSGMQQLVAI